MIQQYIRIAFLLAVCSPAVFGNTNTDSTNLRRRTAEAVEHPSHRELTSNGECKTGTSAELISWCGQNGRNCCDGVDACNFSGTKTICDGSCNGQGSCLRFGGTHVGHNSCNGLGACGEFTGTTISSNSCNSRAACFRFNGNAIGPDSCNNFQACHATDGTNVPAVLGCNGFGASTGCDSKVVMDFEGTAAQVTEACGGLCCVGDSVGGACRWSGSKKIGLGSCMGRFACKDFRGNSIGADSCDGNGSCRNFQGDDIGSDACVGYAACYNFIGHSVDDNSCIGLQTCYKVDARNEPLVTECVGTGACSQKVY